jgi:phenylpropionate dioxygenase-like ring-hydroxylating dioxygenase large terminal subunit
VLSLLTPGDYFDEGVFKSEVSSLFSTAWRFVGLRSALAKPDTSICRNLGTETVVVQNFAGELAAFSNLCAHRSSPLKSEGEDSGPLRCPYHGWTYNARGEASTIPFRNSFTPEDLSPDRVSLRKWDVETCGNLVFVRKASNGIDLRTFLGPVAERLEEIGHALGEEISKNNFVVSANWKLWIENSVEGYHVAHVHPNSIAQIVPTENSREAQGDHSIVRGAVRETKSSGKMLEKVLPARVLKHDDYEHIFVFPDLCVTSTRGLVFDIIRNIGVTATATRVESTLYRTRFDGAVPGALLDEFYKVVDTSARVVQEEDRAIVELVAKGVRESDRRATLGTLENRIQHFHQTYRKWSTDAQSTR